MVDEEKRRRGLVQFSSGRKNTVNGDEWA
jgi:hypothetical protein